MQGTSVIIGARNDTQLTINLAAADLKLSVAERPTLDAVSQTPLACSYWHQVATVSERLGAADLSLLGPHLTS